MISKLINWFRVKYTGRYKFNVRFNEFSYNGEPVNIECDYGALYIELASRKKAKEWRWVTNCYRRSIKDKLEDYVHRTEAKEFTIGNFNTIITVKVQSL